MLQCDGPMSPALRALPLLKQNIRTLLGVRKEDQVTLARYCGHSKAWINKFLNEQDVEVQLKDLDRIADFFGIATYQLFQPGISALTERRIASERRSGRDRRIGHGGRHLAYLRAEANKLPHAGGALGGVASARASARQRLTEQFERDLHALDTGEQTPTPRASRARKTAVHRATDGPDAKKVGR